MAEFITIRKDNVELTVPVDQKDRYLKLGYSVYDGKKLVEASPTKDVAELQHLVEQLTSENTELKAEISKLKKKATAKKEA